MLRDIRFLPFTLSKPGENAVQETETAMIIVSIESKKKSPVNVKGNACKQTAIGMRTRTKNKAKKNNKQKEEEEIEMVYQSAGPECCSACICMQVKGTKMVSKQQHT